VQGREEGRLIYELIEGVEDGNGLAALPSPSSADIFLDLESNPYVLDQGLEYLFGIVTLPANSTADLTYDTLWSFTRSEEKKSFETFVAMVMERWRRNPEMHIYHYAPYEPTAIKRLVGRHGTCVDEVDELLRAGVFVDLYRAVRQGIRASVESYSIKRIEPLYEFTRTVPLRDANFALQSYEAAMARGNDLGEIGDLLKTIEGYNRDDCVSALRLRDWLEERRKELEAKCGRELPRPPIKSGQPGIDLAAQLDVVAEVKARLLAALPEDETGWRDEDRARWLLAQMLEWHRREEKSAWWEYFRLCELSEDELQEDKSALGGLAFVGEVDHIKRSIVYRYSFPPQDHTIDRALEVHDPRTGKPAGECVAFDEHNRTIDLKRGASSSVPHPTALIPYDIVGSNVLRGSILLIASWVADHGITGTGPFQSARELLLRERPHVRLEGVGTLIGENEQLTQEAKALVRSLSQSASVLPIQGPPGSGKTFTGARMIVELVKRGRRVRCVCIGRYRRGFFNCTAREVTGTCPVQAVLECRVRAIDGCSSTFAEMANTILPGYMAKLRLATLRPLSSFCRAGVGVRSVLSELDRGNDFSCCYVLFREGKPFYVGISRTVVQRLRQHVMGRTHFDASLTYRIATVKTGRKMKRAKAMQDAAFREAFNKEQALLRVCNVAFVEISNPLELYLFEAYCAVELDTGQWNTFQTH
jgi:RNase_H superfamily